MDIPGVAVGEILPKDDRIYEDSKGRPVGIATMIIRITNTRDRPQMAPTMTPEDKRILDTLFQRCFDHVEAYLHSTQQAAKKKRALIVGSCLIDQTESLDSALENHPVCFRRILI